MASSMALHLRPRFKISSYGSECSSVAPKSVIQVDRTVDGLGMSWQEKRLSPLRRVKAWNKVQNEREESVSAPKGKNGSKKKGEGLVDDIEAELGRQFGGWLWFSVLFLFLVLFAGGYAFLIFNYADFSDIPILRGPQR